MNINFIQHNDNIYSNLLPSALIHASFFFYKTILYYGEGFSGDPLRVSYYRIFQIIKSAWTILVIKINIHMYFLLNIFKKIPQ